MHFDMQKYIYSEKYTYYLFNTLYIEIKQMLKNFLRTEQTLQKMHSFFFGEP